LIPIPFSMLLSSTVFSVLLGIFSSILYSFTELLARVICRFLNSHFKRKNAKNANFLFLRNAFGFSFALCLGITYILCCYILLDGVFDGYSMILLLLSFLFTRKTFFKLFMHKNKALKQKK